MRNAGELLKGKAFCGFFVGWVFGLLVWWDVGCRVQLRRFVCFLIGLSLKGESAEGSRRSRHTSRDIGACCLVEPRCGYSPSNQRRER